MTSLPRPRLIASLLCAAACAACSADFDPYGRLSALRVLAVQSEPVAPAPGETTTLRALIYTPPGETVVEERWSWCPFAAESADGGACLVTEAELAALAGPDADIPPYDLGAGPTAQLAHSIPTSLLDQLCEGTAAQPAVADCTGGFPVQIRHTVRTASDEVVTIRRLRLRRDADPGHTNPRIDGLAAADTVDGSNLRELTEQPDVTLPRGVVSWIGADVAPEMAETYDAVDEDGRPVVARERLNLSWFVESGDTGFERTGFIDGIEPLEDALWNEWEPALTADYARDTARLIVVMRDNREGVTWREATVRLGGAQ